MRAYARPLSINCLARNLKKEFRTQVEVLYYGGAVLYILQETFQDESYNALFASLFLFFSQSAAPYYMNMSSTIKKKVTLCETSIVDLNTERKDRQDARWRDPARQDKQRKRSLRDKFNQNSL